MSESCESCYFFLQKKNPMQLGGEVQGDCRRYPPTVHAIMMKPPSGITQPGQMALQFVASWPTVKGEQWCGEYQIKMDLVNSEVDDIQCE